MVLYGMAILAPITLTRREIDDDVLRRIEYDLDLEEARLK